VLHALVSMFADHDYDDDFDAADRPKTIYDTDDLAAAASSRAAYYHGYNEWLLGDFHGFQPDFSGIGVIFDTYANEGHYNHKDITLVVNDRSVIVLTASNSCCRNMLASQRSVA
jgi:hypothetical protein